MARSISARAIQSGATLGPTAAGRRGSNSRKVRDARVRAARPAQRPQTLNRSIPRRSRLASHQPWTGAAPCSVGDSATLVRYRRLGVRRVGRVLLDAADEIERSVKRLVVLRIFYSSNEQFDRLSQLKGKRIAVGPEGSGTRASAEQILGKGGVNSETATFLPFAGTTAVEAMNDGKVDAVWIIGAPDATAVKSFLQNPNVRIMSLPMAEAFTRIFPDLTRLVLPQV